MIRAVRPTDVAALRALLGRTGAVEVTTHTWPKVEPESGHLPVLRLLSQAIRRASQQGGMWVASAEGSVRGFLAAGARCEGLVWDVEHLHSDQESAAVDLLDSVCGYAADGGALRVFLEVPAGSSGVELGRRAGFERYAGASLVQLRAPFRIDKSGVFNARPRLRADDHQLFQLYNASVPAPVRAAEAMTYDEWSALHRGKKRWAPSLFGDRHQFVWEIGDGLAGWFEMIYGQKSQYLDFVVHPRYENMLDRMVGYALTQASERAAVFSTPREYQAGLLTALQRARFQSIGEAEILVRQLAARVPQPAFMPANAVGG